MHTSNSVGENYYKSLKKKKNKQDITAAVAHFGVYNN